MVGIGGFLYLFFPSMLTYGVQTATQLHEDGMLTNIWRDIPIPLKLCVTIFSIQNPDDFVDGEKPKLQEMGPYCYE